MNRALELVRAYEAESVWSDIIVSEWIHNAAAELRRLAAENAELDKAGRQVAEELAQVKGAYDYLQEERDELAARLDALALQEPVAVADEREAFLLGGRRFKIGELEGGNYGIGGLPQEMNGQWIALVDATDDAHMQARAALQPAQNGDDQEPAAYLHRMEKTTELSFWGEDAECAGRKDWIGCAPLFLHRDKGYLATFAQPSQTGDVGASASVPEGWEIIAAKGLSELVYALERAERKGNLPYDFEAPFAAFDYQSLAATPQPDNKEGK